MHCEQPHAQKQLCTPCHFPSCLCICVGWLQSFGLLACHADGPSSSSGSFHTHAPYPPAAPASMQRARMHRHAAADAPANGAGQKREDQYRCQKRKASAWSAPSPSTTSRGLVTPECGPMGVQQPALLPINMPETLNGAFDNAHTLSAQSSSALRSCPVAQAEKFNPGLLPQAERP